MIDNNKIFVSFIIPVFNCKDYILDCIESLIKIKREDIEFIFINDGSSDGSEKILNFYISKDARIKVIDKCNEGVSIARNTGIKKALGKWITFIDSDDCIFAKIYERAILALNENIDLAILAVTEDKDKKNLEQEYCEKFDIIYNENLKGIRKAVIALDSKEAQEYKKNGIWLHSIFGKFYKSDIIKKQAIDFNFKLDLGEDVLFNYLYLKYVGNVYINNSISYFYNINNSSAMHGYRNNKAQSFLNTVQIFMQVIPDELDLIYQFGIKQYLYSLQLDFCHIDNPKSYKQRKAEAYRMRQTLEIEECFVKGSIFRLRKVAIPLAIPAKLGWFGICNIMLKCKKKMKIKF